MNEDLISVIEIARIHGKRPQSIHKIIGRLGIETKKIKSKEARGQRVSYIAREDYTNIRENLTQSDIDQPEQENTSSPGVFYLIQLEPEHDPGRYKLGFASNIDERMRSHKTIAPFAKLIATWPCKLLWEKTAIESITATSEKVHTEVFRNDDIEEIRKRGDKFFSLMPKLA